MTWTTPATKTTGTLITATIYNAQIINNIAHVGAMKVMGTALSGKTAGNELLDIPSICDGRLTAGSDAVTTTDHNSGSVYYRPYKGNKIALFSGTEWVIREFAALEQELSGLTASKVYDVFAYDSSGTVMLEFVAWTNTTTRATALTTQDGVYVKSGATTRRYLGSFYNSSGQTVSDAALDRLLWNYYNRVRKTVVGVPTTDSWTYASTTFRAWNNDVSNKVSFIIGVSEDNVDLRLTGSSLSASNTGGIIGIGNNSISTNSGTIKAAGNPITGDYSTVTAEYVGAPGVGFRPFYFLEACSAANSITFYGDAGAPTTNQNGMSGHCWC